MSLLAYFVIIIFDLNLGNDWDYVMEYETYFVKCNQKSCFEIYYFVSYSCASDIMDTINITVFDHRNLILWMTAAYVALSFGPQDRGCYNSVSYTHLTLPTTPYV